VSAAGLIFGGWWTAPVGGELAGVAGGSFSPVADVTLYARWSRASAPPQPIRYAPYATASEASTPSPSPTVLPRISPDSLSARIDPATIAQELGKLGLLAGTGANAEGEPVFELEGSLTRMQSLALVIRLMGLEEEASRHQGASPFKDVPDWGLKYAAFAYSIGLTVGVNEEHTLFSPDQLVTQREFCAFLLRVLHFFESEGDFAFADSVDMAKKIGVLAANEESQPELKRGGAVVAMARSLLAVINKADMTLLEKLVEDGVISQQSASAFLLALDA
jgi:hypothetical protein